MQEKTVHYQVEHLLMAFLNPVELLFDETHADVHFECEENGETVSIPAHKIVLRACSTVFHAAITLTTSGKRNDQEEPLPVPAGISLRSFKIFLSWMYTGQLRHALKGDEPVANEEDFETSLADCLGVLYLANMHEMTGLSSLILTRIPDTIRGDYEIAKVILDRGYLIAQVEETPENKLDRKRCSFAFSRACAWLIEEYFSTNGNHRAQLSEIDHKQMVFLLGRDELCIREHQLYQFLIRWARCRHLEGSLKTVVGALAYQIRIPLISQKQFAQGPATDRIFSDEETINIFRHYNDCHTFRLSDPFYTDSANRCVNSVQGGEDMEWRENFMATKEGMAPKRPCGCKRPASHGTPPRNKPKATFSLFGENPFEGADRSQPRRRGGFNGLELGSRVTHTSRDTLHDWFVKYNPN